MITFMLFDFIKGFFLIEFLNRKISSKEENWIPADIILFLILWNYYLNAEGAKYSVIKNKFKINPRIRNP